MKYTHIKTIADIIIASVSLLILSPVIIFITIILAFANGGNPFFFQTRVGKYEKQFRIIKFRTMNNKRDSDGNLLSDEERLTSVGKFIRSTSLDEIPQLFNVATGDMALIGPRPLLVSYIPLYNERQRKRHNVLPGITGWAQVNGRNSISWENKFEHDVWYVENISFLLDLKILILTFWKVIKRDDISSADCATMEPFTGNK